MDQELINARLQKRLTWLIFLDSAVCLFVDHRKVEMQGTLSLSDLEGSDRSVQTLLEEFYHRLKIDQSAVQQIDLCFLNSIFHKTAEGKLECFMNQRPGFLYYHSLFEKPVTSGHIARRMSDRMKEWGTSHPEVNLWFHLRHETLYVAFRAADGEIVIRASEVRKTLDVHYYILFHVNALRSMIAGEQSKMAISGELLMMSRISEFVSKNFPDREIIRVPQLLPVHGKWDDLFETYLPEILG